MESRTDESKTLLNSNLRACKRVEFDSKPRPSIYNKNADLFRDRTDESNNKQNCTFTASNQPKRLGIELINYSTKLNEYRGLRKNKRQLIANSIPDRLTMEKVLKQHGSNEKQSDVKLKAKLQGSIDNKILKNHSDVSSHKIQASNRSVLKFESEIFYTPKTPMSGNNSKLTGLPKPVDVSCVNKHAAVQNLYNSILGEGKVQLDDNGYQIDFCYSSEDSAESGKKTKEDQADMPLELMMASKLREIEIRKQIFEQNKVENTIKIAVNAIEKSSKTPIQEKKIVETDLYKKKKPDSKSKLEAQRVSGTRKSRTSQGSFGGVSFNKYPCAKFPIAEKQLSFSERLKGPSTKVNPLKPRVGNKLSKPSDIMISRKSFKTEIDSILMNLRVLAESNNQEALNLKQYLDLNLELNEKRAMTSEDRLGNSSRMNESFKDIIHLESLLEGMSKKAEVNSEMVNLNNQKASLEADMLRLEIEIQESSETIEVIRDEMASINNEITDLQKNVDYKDLRMVSTLENFIDTHRAVRNQLGLFFDISEETVVHSELTLFLDNIQELSSKGLKWQIEAHLDELLQFEYENSSHFQEQIEIAVDSIYLKFVSKLFHCRKTLASINEVPADLYLNLEAHISFVHQNLLDLYSTIKNKLKAEVKLDQLMGYLESQEVNSNNNKQSIEDKRSRYEEFSKECGMIAAQKMDLRWQKQNLFTSRNFDDIFNATGVNNYDQALLMDGEAVECNIQNLQTTIGKDKRRLEYMNAKTNLLAKLVTDNRHLVKQLADDCCINFEKEVDLIDTIIHRLDNVKFKDLRLRRELITSLVSNLRAIRSEKVEEKVFIKAVLGMRLKLSGIEVHEIGREGALRCFNISERDLNVTKASLNLKNTPKDQTLSSLNNTLNPGMNEKHADIYRKVTGKVGFDHIKLKSCN